MKKLAAILLSALLSGVSVQAQIKELRLPKERVVSLLECAKSIDKGSFKSQNQIDSVVALYPSIQGVGQDGLNLVFSFLVPHLVPGLPGNTRDYDRCAPLAENYTAGMASAAGAIVEKYPGTTEETLLRNLESFFQLYLYTGLSANGKLALIQNPVPEHLSSQELEKLFIEARGSSADEMIYFVMAHSSVYLFGLFD